MSKRFDYVKYNEVAANLQAALKEKFIALEEALGALPEGRGKALALTKLEEAYMWSGKAIRDQQVLTDPSTELQEGRANS